MFATDSPHRSRDYLDEMVSPSERKLRLFMIQSVHRRAELFGQPELLSAVNAYADYLDGQLPSSEMFAAFESVPDDRQRELLTHIARPTARSAAREELSWTVRAISYHALETQFPDLHLATTDAEIERYKRLRCAIVDREDEIRLGWLREIFHQPTELATFPNSWRSESAVALARTAYDTRDFALLPILADALEDAGCENLDVLTHCRNPKQLHVRGCWVVDGVLGKS